MRLAQAAKTHHRRRRRSRPPRLAPRVVCLAAGSARGGGGDRVQESTGGQPDPQLRTAEKATDPSPAAGSAQVRLAVPGCPAAAAAAASTSVDLQQPPSTAQTQRRCRGATRLRRWLRGCTARRRRAGQRRRRRRRPSSRVDGRPPGPNGSRSGGGDGPQPSSWLGAGAPCGARLPSSSGGVGEHVRGLAAAAQHGADSTAVQRRDKTPPLAPWVHC